MKTILVTCILLALGGCAGLSLNADFYGTYRSDVPVGDRLKK